MRSESEKSKEKFTLGDFGLTSETPSETILTTYSQDGNPHASAIGIKSVGNMKIRLKIFTSSKTFRNLSRNGDGVVNVVSDAGLLAKLGLPKIFGPEGESLEFESSKSVDAPRLREADAFIEFEVEKVKRSKIKDEIGTSELAHITGTVKNLEIGKSPPHPFKRIEFLLIESAITATRAIEALRRGKKEVAENLIEDIDTYLEKCERLGPKSSEAELIRKILNFLEGREAL